MSGAPDALSILVAEDDDDDCMIFEEALEGVDVELEFTPDGVELMARLEAWPAHASPPLVFIDLNMPRMNGWEVLGAIRSSPRLRATPVLVMSTSGAPEDIARAYAEGANTFFTKPMRFDELKAALAVVVEYWGGLARWPSPPSG